MTAGAILKWAIFSKGRVHMKTRGYWSTFIMITAITTFPMILGSALIHSLVWEMKYSQSFPFGILYGISFGLLFGLTMAFFLKVLTISVPFKDKRAFLLKLNITLAEIGYHPESQIDNFLTYKPSFQAGVLSGKISVQIENNYAKIIGPNMHLKKVQKLINLRK